MVLGIKVKTILGYPGSADKVLAVERGELDDFATGDLLLLSIPVDWIKNKKINIIYRSSDTLMLPLGIPASAPYIMDLVQNPEQQKLVKLLLAPTVVGRPYIASKGNSSRHSSPSLQKRVCWGHVEVTRTSLLPAPLRIWQW